jgi:TolA-binding protein
VLALLYTLLSTTSNHPSTVLVLLSGCSTSLAPVSLVRRMVSEKAHLNLNGMARLVEELRKEVVELQGQWTELNEKLEDKRGRLRLAEATLEVLQELVRTDTATTSQEAMKGSAGGEPREGSKGKAAVPEAPPRGQASDMAVVCRVVLSMW